ncbi:MAG: hypothetical protein COU08_03030 [Candidatus Harrisonbacteria bacterium CG10_big_fil_rev_8_21_14_0_10_42_17]|uniref:Uncharacterized protein n=1 Tax=Candidatus Harrisonbacteria bacterium CG10_big_fil_rev_8_21_14_0_10_42_17 TaxID=1974584 RepID=A0A2M6WHI2_9BACT|nr:MAG: hypothetical protein COU08_03030 [Candidatus Harrisonbacteria bacterium CG10_big_fil_rev_8_21_14_0_10_42_17]
MDPEDFEECDVSCHYPGNFFPGQTVSFSRRGVTYRGIIPRFQDVSRSDLLPGIVPVSVDTHDHDFSFFVPVDDIFDLG